MIRRGEAGKLIRFIHLKTGNYAIAHPRGRVVDRLGCLGEANALARKLITNRQDRVGLRETYQKERAGQ